MAKLSDRIIRDLKPGAVDTWISDGDGLNIRIRQNGTKTWVIRRKRGGKTGTETIGEFPDMDCKAARAEFAKRSFSPNLNRLTFGELLDEWYSRRIEPRYRVTKNAETTPVAANRCASTMKLALNYAVECGYLDRNPLQAVTLRVIGGEEKTRGRVLTDDEIRWVFSDQCRPLMRFLLLTGLRISEGQSGKRDGDFFRIERTKNGTPHWVYLPELAKQQLTGAIDVSPTAYQAWLRNTAKKTFTPHDLRRTFATRLAGLNIPPHIIEKCLNHRMQGVMGIYNRAEYEADRIAAAQVWAIEIGRIIGAVPSNTAT
jgi:integrase